MQEVHWGWGVPWVSHLGKGRGRGQDDMGLNETSIPLRFGK
jgi:hypothetical protein